MLLPGERLPPLTAVLVSPSGALAHSAPGASIGGVVEAVLELVPLPDALGSVAGLFWPQAVAARASVVATKTM